MRKLNRLMSRRNLLRIIFLGAPAILVGCGEMSAQEKKRIRDNIRLMKRTSIQRRNLLSKVRQGYEGYPPPEPGKFRRRR